LAKFGTTAATAQRISAMGIFGVAGPPHHSGERRSKFRRTPF
jgi:hypothetical protein